MSYRVLYVNLTYISIHWIRNNIKDYSFVLCIVGYLIVDELENSINKQLVFAIMDLFASPVTNPHGATLLFSTHYPELLDHFTRKDSIWFAVRDGKGFALRNLGAYLGRTDLKKSVSFFANRVPGTAPSYAAVRALQDYAERYVHA